MNTITRLTLVLILVAGIFVAIPAQTQVYAGGADEIVYHFASSSDNSNPEKPTYSWEDVSSSDPLIFQDKDAGLSEPLDLGFTFQYYGVAYTQVYACVNGFIIFLPPNSQHPNTCSYPDAHQLPDITPPLPDVPKLYGIIAGWWGDLDLTNLDLSGNPGTIRYKTFVGQNSKKYLVIQYQNVPHHNYGGGSAAIDPVSMEFKLFEGTNDIEVHYLSAPASKLGVFADNISHSAGIENADNSHGLSYYFGSNVLTPLSAVRYYFRDTQPPVITLLTTPSNPTNHTYADFSFNVEDHGGSGLVSGSSTCQLDTGTIQPCLANTYSATGLQDGTHTLHITAADGASNIGTADYQWRIDTTKPITAITSKPTDPSNIATPTFGFSDASNPGDTTVVYACKLDLAASYSACPSVYTTSALGEGLHKLYVYATDGAGNTDDTPAYHQWNIDLTPPNINITSSPKAATNVNAAQFAFSGSDGNGSGVARYECSLEGGSFATCSSPQNYLNLSDGPHSFKVKAFDVAGNESTPSSFSWTIKTSIPAAPVLISLADKTQTINPRPTLSWKASSGATGYTVLLDGQPIDVGNVTTYSPPALQKGTHLWFVRAYDGYGNTSIDVSPWQFTVGWPIYIPQVRK